MSKKSNTEGFTGSSPVPVTKELPSKALSRNARMAAQMLGLGYSVEETATDTGLSVTHLKVLKRSRLFQVEMDKATDKFIKNHADIAKERFFAKTPQMMEMVEGMAEDPKTPAATRHAIARDYYNRVVPPKGEGGQQTPTIVINISDSEHKNIEATLVEFKDLGGEDIEDADIVEDEDEGTDSNP